MTDKVREKEELRLEEMRKEERAVLELSPIAGVDEAGRGPLAGPVVAACAVIPLDYPFYYLNDSKKMSEKRREALFEELQKEAIAFGIGIVSPERIDEINILQATYEAMRLSIREMEKNFSIKPSILFNDAVTIPMVDIPQIPIVHGDAKSLSIAAASVLAKVSRDHLMLDYAKEYPEYGFEKHKGYGTKAHTEAILEHGPCPIHRRSFLKKLYAGES